MATLALPDGYVDTGYNPSLTLSGTIQLKNLQLHVGPGAVQHGSIRVETGAGVLEWALEKRNSNGTGCTQVGGAPGQVVSGDVYVLVPGVADYLAESFLSACEPIGTEHDSSVYDFTFTAGPFRLGMRVINTDSTPQFPHWAKADRAEFAWFADEDTKFNGILGPIGTGDLYFLTAGASPPTPTVIAVPLPGFTQVQAAVTSNSPAATVVEWTNLAGAGVTLDTNGLHNGDLIGTGGGTIICDGTHSGGIQAWYLPYLVRERAGVIDAVGGDFGATVLDADGNLRTTPVDVLRVYQNASWVSQDPLNPERSWIAQAAWCAAQDPPWPNDDRNIMWELAPPRQFGGDRRFYPVTVDVASPLSVHRPDGNTPSVWVSSDTGSITVDDSDPDETVVTVTAEGASISRTLASEYPQRIGMAGFGAPFGFGEKENQTHQSGEDIVNWGSYSYMDWLVTGGSLGDKLAFAVDGSWYDITDNYNTSGATREAGYSVAETQYTVGYTITDRGDVTADRLDLCFPGGAPRLPHYHGTARKLTLSGFLVGTYRIRKADLVASLGNFKSGWGKQISRYDYSMMHAAVNGASPHMNWGDRYIKEPEVEALPGIPTSDRSDVVGSGGPIRLANIIESDEVGTLDTQWGLEDFFNLWPGAEGLTRVWDQDAFDAACKDPYGASLGSLAQWVLSVFNAKWTVGGGYRPACSVVCGSALICPGVPFDFYADLTFGGALEVLAGVGARRASAGEIIKVRRADTGAVEASGITDADGFAVLLPVDWTGDHVLETNYPKTAPEEVTGKPRDRPRMYVRLTSGTPDNLVDPIGRFHRASGADLGAGDTLVYRRMDYNTPEGGGWAVETDLGPDATQPALAIDAQDLQLRVSLAYTRDAGVYERTSDDDGETFEDEALVIPNGTLSRNFPTTPAPTGDRFIAAVVPGSPATIQCVYRGPGDTAWSSVFTWKDQDGADLQVEADAFAVAWSLEPGTGFLRFVVSLVISGEDEVSEWACDAEPDFASPEMRWERLT